MEGISPFVAVALALLFLLMLLMFFFLLRSISRLNVSIDEFRHLPLRSDGIMGRMSMKDLETSILHLSNTLNYWRKEAVSKNVNSPTTSKTEISFVNINELKGLSESLDLFTKGIKDLSAFTTGVQELNRNLLEHKQRTDALITIAEFYKKQMTDIETRQDAIRASVVKIDDQMQSALKMFEENSQKGLNQLQQTFLHQIDIMERTSQSSILEERLNYMDAALKAVALLQPLENTLSTLNERLLPFLPGNKEQSQMCNVYRENVKPYNGEREEKEKIVKLKVLEETNKLIQDQELQAKETESKINTLVNERNNIARDLTRRLYLNPIFRGKLEILITESGTDLLLKDNGWMGVLSTSTKKFSSRSTLKLASDAENTKDIRQPQRRNTNIYKLDSVIRLIGDRIVIAIPEKELFDYCDPMLFSLFKDYFATQRHIVDLHRLLDLRHIATNRLSHKKQLVISELEDIDKVLSILKTFDEGYKPSVIYNSDNSMSPTVNTGDTVILETQKEGYYENDIVYVRLLNCYRLRRVIRLLGGGELEVQGDANEHPEYIVMADIIGKVIKIEKKKSDKGVPINKK